jgi:hypothetical protein
MNDEIMACSSEDLRASDPSAADEYRNVAARLDLLVGLDDPDVVLLRQI